MYMRADGGSYVNMIKILKGLNSNTFNYLENHRENLLIDNSLPKYNLTSKELSSMEFFSDCVRYNRPCELKEMAKNWPAIEKWAQTNNGTEYLKEKFGEAEIGVFLDEDNTENSFATH
jgi:hypothetical protein